MTELGLKVFKRSAMIGSALTLLVLLLDARGWLGGLEKWLYDRRIADCQFFRKPPTDRIVHLDIDDKAIDAIGRWPWARSTQADLLEEIALAKPKVLGIDVVYSDPSLPAAAAEDQAMARAFSHLNMVIPLSVELAAPRSVSTLESAVLAELTKNLEITPEELASLLRKKDFPSEQVQAEIAANFLPARREAMSDRISRELASESLTLDQLDDRLLPKTEKSTSYKTLKSPLRRLLQDEYEHAIALREGSRFGLSIKGVPKMLITTPKLMPIPSFSQAATGGGFVDVDNMSEAVVRWIPMFVSQNDRIFPQWGLAFGCALIDADLNKAVISPSKVVVPSPHGDVVIPLRDQYSATFKGKVSLIADINWFGSEAWDTMYDWPDHKTIKAHLSMNAVWEICLTREKLRTNNTAIDQAAEDVLNAGPDRFGLDSAVWKKYVESKPGPEDVPARRKIIESAKKVLDESGYSMMFSQVKPEDLKPDERKVFDLLNRTSDVMKRAMEQNDGLVTQLAQFRNLLAEKIENKGVLIGSTATSASDFVTTSLHPRCPGVVVHSAIANAVVTGQWWRTAPFWVTALLTLLLGVLISLATGWLSPSGGVVTAIAAAATYFVINGIVLFDWGHWIVGAAGPLVAVTLTWSGCIVTRLITEGIDRIRKERDLAVFRHEMSLAKNVQQALIPKADEMPKITGIEPFGWTKAADETGGDLFDLWTLPDGRLGILVADASGHGLAPSVIVSQVRTLVRALSEIEKHPNGLLARVNARLAQDLEPARFVTAFLGFLDSEGRLDWASAGHGPMLWCSKDGDEFLSLDATALPLGIMPDYMGDEIGPLQLDLSGMLIVTSDGIFEAPDPKGEQYGIERVIEVLKKHQGQTTVEMSLAIQADVTKWQAKDKPADDQTTVIIRRVEAGISVTVVEKGAQEVVATNS